jgi:hypothetical protein
MTNDEILMTKEFPNDPMTKTAAAARPSWGLRRYLVIGVQVGAETAGGKGRFSRRGAESAEDPRIL